MTNVWWRRGGTLYTPSLDLGILAGVTRAVCSRSRRAGYEVVEGAYPLADLLAADEAFTSSSVREVMPVVGSTAPVGTGAGRGYPAGGVAEAGRGGDVKRLIFKVASTFHTALYRLSGGRLGGNLGRAPVLLLTVAGGSRASAARCRCSTAARVTTSS